MKTILIPVYNEAPSVLKETILQLLRTLPDYQLLLVDDGSLPQKSCRSLLKEQGFSDEDKKKIRLLEKPVNQGQGAALESGMDYLRQHPELFGPQDCLVHFDADGQHSASDIPRMECEMAKGDADILLGSRFLQKETVEMVPLARKLLLKGAVVINWILTGLWLSDAHNGFRMLNAKAVQAIHLREPGMEHATEILLSIKRNHLRVKEVPVQIQYTDYSRQKGQRWYHAIRILLKLLNWRLFRS